MRETPRATFEMKYFPEVFPKISIILNFEVWSGYQICQITFELRERGRG
jgi:hypothetical protein